jgi:hypothetical protein
MGRGGGEGGKGGGGVQEVIEKRSRHRYTRFEALIQE